jgi:hypothetical protein
MQWKGVVAMGSSGAMPRALEDGEQQRGGIVMAGMGPGKAKASAWEDGNGRVESCQKWVLLPRDSRAVPDSVRVFPRVIKGFQRGSPRATFQYPFRSRASPR